MNPSLAILKNRFQSKPKPTENLMLTGVETMDRLAGGIPRGAITELVGGPSTGKTTLLYSLFAGATARQEACVLVDTGDAFDPASAAKAGIDLRFLLWVRCAVNKKCALQTADWLLQGGGFGVVALDLGHLTPHDLRNIPLHSWFRFRHAVENKPTSLVVVAPEPCTGSAVSLRLEMKRKTSLWQGQLFRGVVLEAAPKKPAGTANAIFEADTCLLA